MEIKVGQVGRQNKTKKNMNIIKKPNKFGISCLKIVQMGDH